MKTTPSQAEWLMAQGYRVTSRTHRLVSRIDRSDWRTVARELDHLTEAQAEDQYRRVYSKDTHTVSQSTCRGIRSSIGSVTGFIPRKT